MSELITISPPLQALLAGLMTWGLTAVGSALVLIIRRPRPITLDAMLAFGAGVMLAASYFSLLAPAIELATSLRQSPFFMAALGFMAGGLMLMLSDALLSRRLSSARFADQHRRTALLITSITLHNIPEGLSIGVAFGAASLNPSAATFTGAWMLALGVGLQNTPEGAAVSLPLYRDGLHRGRAFFWGQASAIVEPIAAVAGALLAMCVQPILPFALAFAAGAMVSVVIGELVPESQRNTAASLMTLFSMLGFTVMMVLDVAFS